MALDPLGGRAPPWLSLAGRGVLAPATGVQAGGSQLPLGLARGSHRGPLGRGPQLCAELRGASSPQGW